jgi:hypothetical protein
MAFSAFGEIYGGVYAIWDDPAQDADNLAWVRSMNTALEPHMVGRYIGDADIEADLDHTKQSFSPSAWDQIGVLKQKYDPESVFASFLGLEEAGK